MENNVGIRDILEYHFFKSHACIISDEDINQALSQIDSLFQQRLAEKKEELVKEIDKIYGFDPSNEIEAIAGKIGSQVLEAARRSVEAQVKVQVLGDPKLKGGKG